MSRVVETITQDDLPGVATVLSRAFRDNPGFCGILRGDSPTRRERVLLGCMLGFHRKSESTACASATSLRSLTPR
jgi:hypothetical protein